jgi:hypothetical protein
LTGVGLGALFLLSGCSLVRCVPARIVVAETRHDERLERRVESMTVDPVFGRVHEVAHDVIVQQYWVRALDGEWIAVGETTWREAERGRELEVCR